MIITKTETLKVDSLDALNFFYERFKETCEKYKEQRQDRFNYIIEPNFDDLELTIEMNFIEKENVNNTEGDPRLN
jgi:poly-D-alanine transfer protein DltD